jgi:hypothetical protein
MDSVHTDALHHSHRQCGGHGSVSQAEKGYPCDFLIIATIRGGTAPLPLLLARVV